MPHYELNLRDYWRIIKKKRMIVIVTLIMLSLFSLIFAIMNRPEPLYRAQLSLKIEKRTDLTGLYLYSWGSGDDLATRAEEIKSYPMLEKAAQAMGLIDSNLTSEQIRNNRQYLDIVSKLRSRIKTEQEGYTNIINIIVTDYDPEFTAKLANALGKVYTVESFKDRNLSAQRALEAVRHQRDVALRALRESETRVRNYREQNRFVTMDGAAAQISSALAKAEENLAKIQADIHQIDNILQETINNREYIYNANLNLLLNQPNRFLEDLQSRLNQARVTKANYAQYYTPNHPTIKNLETEITNLEKRFIAELKAYRKNLAQAEVAAYNKWKALDEDYKSLPLLSLNLSNLEREREINTQIYQTLEAKYQEALIRASEQVQEVSILRPAFVPTAPINPTMIGPTTAIGTVIGLILGIVLAFVAETLDTTFSTIEDIEKTLETTVMGIIPFVNIEEIKASLQEKMETPVPDDILEMQARLFSHYNPKSTMAESFRNLRTNVHFALLDKGYKTIMVTSSVASEGKTTVAANLAVSLAQIGINTLLVEADLRKPRISKLFGIEREPGITDIILRKEPLDNAIRTMSDLMMGVMSTEPMESGNITGIEYLNILTCGRIEKNPSEIIASKLMDGLIAELKERYDVVIFDSAPVIQATDATVLGSKVDTTLLVYYQGKISRGTLRRSKSQLEMLKSDILGVVVNGMRADVSADYSDYKYSYEYHYHEGEKVEQNKLVSWLANFFLKPTEGLPRGIWERLRKGNILLLMLGLAALVFGTAFIANEIKSARKSSSSQDQPPVTVVVPKPDTTTVIADTVALEPTPVQEIPPEIHHLRAELGIKAPAEPAASPSAEKIPTTTTPPASASISPQSASAPTTPVISAASYLDLPQIEKSSPFCILIRRSRDLTILKNLQRNYRANGISTYITPDFSNPELRYHALCYGSFATSQAAQKKIGELRAVDSKANLRIVQLPYALSLATNSSENFITQLLRNNLALRDFLYIQKSEDTTTKAPKFYLLFGAFPSPETAELTQALYPELQTATLIKR
jgi:capsular exopolysaccharide synthesis family protein